MPPSPFLSRVRDFMAVRRYSPRTIKSYSYWIKYYIIFNNKQHPVRSGAAEVEAFLTHLAIKCQVSPATQAVALNALVFLYKNVLNKLLGEIGDFRHSTRQRKLPTVLTQEEVRRLMSYFSGSQLLMASLLYGSGLRRIELVRLRIKDVDFDHLQLRIWYGKGAKHRLTTLAQELLPLLKKQIAQVENLLASDCLHEAFSGVWMPDALARKYPDLVDRAEGCRRSQSIASGTLQIKTERRYLHIFLRYKPPML